MKKTIYTKTEIGHKIAELLYLKRKKKWAI